MTKKGFTAIEIILVAIFLIAIGVVFYFQKLDLNDRFVDENRKTEINAIHFNLQHFHKQNGYYPREISEKNLTAIDPNAFSDPLGKKLGEEGAEYRYSATDCEGDKCQNYTLRTSLSKESDFIKSSK